MKIRKLTESAKRALTEAPETKVHDVSDKEFADMINSPEFYAFGESVECKASLEECGEKPAEINEEIKSSTISAFEDCLSKLDNLSARMQTETESLGEAILDGDASKSEIKAELKKTAKINPVDYGAYDDEDDEDGFFEQEATKIWYATELINVDKGSIVDHPKDIQSAMAKSLYTALEQRAAGRRSDFPNILVTGLAGFAKTAEVKKFCTDHHLNLFICDAKSLDSATVGGIPYPKRVKDAAGNDITRQGLLASEYWDALSLPNTVIYFDELNRAFGDVRGSLLSLINEHVLPISYTNKQGIEKNSKRFKNILFSVVTINPATDAFENNKPFDPAEVSRHAASIEAKPDIAKFKKYVCSVFDKIANMPAGAISDEYRENAKSRSYLADNILSYPNFRFDDADAVSKIYQAQMLGINDKDRIDIMGANNGATPNYFNYRTFMLILSNCNGTKASFLGAAEAAGLSKATLAMLKNACAKFEDNPSRKGNGIFKQATPSQSKNQGTVDSMLDGLAGQI